MKPDTSKTNNTFENTFKNKYYPNIIILFVCFGGSFFKGSFFKVTPMTLRWTRFISSQFEAIGEEINPGGLRLPSKETNASGISFDAAILP